MRRSLLLLVTPVLILVSATVARGQLPSSQADGPRRHSELNTDWRVLVGATADSAPEGWLAAGFDDSTWDRVEVPHNADVYHGYRQVKHGNLHGTAWYRRSFTLHPPPAGKRVFLFFEGVGSYATVWVNGREVGRHAGGLTTFTLDVTDALSTSGNHQLAVRADHPAGIRDLPWVCGGCERAYGFSEGSQPFGLFRPVHLVVTDALRVTPFGVHVWNDRTITARRAVAQVRTEIRNHGAQPRHYTVRTRLVDHASQVVDEARTSGEIEPSELSVVAQELAAAPARLWAPDDPYRYTLQTEILAESGDVIDRVDTPFGFRWIDWPVGEDAARGTLLVNGQPVFLNGTCEYSHQLGGSHAFTGAQISARTGMIRAAGFNAFRDAHHPHDLRYQEAWDAHGLAWWTQFGAQIWFDSDAFRKNYLTLLRDWVRERRNSPSLMLWGLQNESKLPAEFARECVELIRALDPTTSSQRLVTTCNGGEGTDWDVPQNWTGTYGGDPATYADDLRRQVLVGEYGGWRSAGLHSVPGAERSGHDEATFTALLETKVRLAETVRDQTVGHFQWIFSTHDNPGRSFGAKGEQLADGADRLSRLGPANNKGLLTLWGEPVDAFHMYRSHSTPVEAAPMVVIAGSAWPGPWGSPGEPRTVTVYSNADEVELFNGYADQASLGTRQRGPRGTSFQWENVSLRYNVLQAVARHNGHVVASDTILLPHLPPRPPPKPPGPATPARSAIAATEGHETNPIGATNGGTERLQQTQTTRESPSSALAFQATRLNGGRSAPGEAAALSNSPATVLYRVNCGGPEYTDTQNRRWEADQPWREGNVWGALSWADAWPHLPPELGSASRVHVPISGTHDDALYQDFRYGRHELGYRFNVPPGRYEIELHFAEPWYGRGGGVDATGWRLFDVAVNGKVLLRDVDLWREAGYAAALRKRVQADARGGKLVVHFPRVAAHQAVIAAIAVARLEDAEPENSATTSPTELQPTAKASRLDNQPLVTVSDGEVEHWLDVGTNAFSNATATLSRIPEQLRFRTWVRRKAGASSSPLTLTARIAGDVVIAAQEQASPETSATWATPSAPAEPTAATAGKTAQSLARPAQLQRDGSWSRQGESIVLSRAGGNPVELPLWRRAVRAGETITFSPAALAIFVPEQPSAPPQVVQSLVVTGSAQPERWSVAGSFQRGHRPHGPERPALDQLPSDLTDADWLRTPAVEAAADLRIQFQVTDHVEILVALPSVAAPPAWLTSWAPNTGRLVFDGIDHRLFTRRYAQGETVVLGPNGKTGNGVAPPMYLVFARPARPSISYPAARATGRPRLSAPNGELTWTIQIGVGDRYHFVIDHAPTQAAARLRYRFLNEAGEELCSEELEIAAATKAPLRLRTCTSVNAGTYRVQVEHLSGAPVDIETLVVQ